MRKEEQQRRQGTAMHSLFRGQRTEPPQEPSLYRPGEPRGVTQKTETNTAVSKGGVSQLSFRLPKCLRTIFQNILDPLKPKTLVPNIFSI